MAAGGRVRAAESARRANGQGAGGQRGRSGDQASRTDRSATAPPQPSSPALLRGRVRLALIRDLAMGEWSNAQIARQLGAVTADVTAFAAEFASEIAEVRAALAGQLAIETSGLWVSKKQNRVAELQSLFEDNERVLAHLRSLSIGDGSGLGSRRHVNVTRSQLAILGAVANEYEPRRGTPTASDSDRHVVHYIIEGPETESLT